VGGSETIVSIVTIVSSSDLLSTYISRHKLHNNVNNGDKLLIITQTIPHRFTRKTCIKIMSPERFRSKQLLTFQAEVKNA